MSTVSYINIESDVFDPSSVSFESEYMWTFYEPNKILGEKLLKKLEFLYPELDIETMFLHAPFKDKISGACKDPQYWADKKYIKYNGTDPQRGFMPSVLDSLSLRLEDLKLTDGTLVVPKFLTTFTMISNVKGKSVCVWTLYNQLNEEVITVKAPPYFIWRFNDIGDYYLRVTVIDTQGNEHVSQSKHAFRVLGIDDYAAHIETKLESRIKEMKR